MDYGNYLIKDQYMKLIEKIVKNKDFGFKQDSLVDSSKELFDINNIRLPPIQVNNFNFSPVNNKTEPESLLSALFSGSTGIFVIMIGVIIILAYLVVKALKIIEKQNQELLQQKTKKKSRTLASENEME